MTGVTLLASGDHHFGEHHRWDECLRVHAWIAEHVERVRPAAFLSAGDLYERASTPVERATVADFLSRIAAVCPVVVARGNHDRHRDLELLGRLRTKHPVIVEERAGVHRVAGCAIAAVAWPSRSALAQSAGRATSPEELDTAARAALEAVIDGLGNELAAHHGPRVLLTHAMIDGSVSSVGQPLVGCEMSMPLDRLARTNADVVVAGHIHKPQEWLSDATPVLYTGSPFRTAFGEMEEKSIVRLDFGDDGRLANWSRVATPATPMLLLKGTFADGGLALDDEPSNGEVTGAEIRLRYAVAADARDAARRAATRWAEVLTHRGAHSVKLEERVQLEVHARAPEVAAARTLADKLRAYWPARGVELAAARAERLLGMLRTLEEVTA